MDLRPFRRLSVGLLLLSAPAAAHEPALRVAELPPERQPSIVAMTASVLVPEETP